MSSTERVLGELMAEVRGISARMARIEEHTEKLNEFKAYWNGRIAAWAGLGGVAGSLLVGVAAEWIRHRAG